MATRKKKAEADASELARGYSVVVEEMRGQFRVFGEKLMAVDDRVTAGFAQMDARFEQVEHRLGRVEHGLERVEQRVERVEHGLERVEQRVERVEVAILETRHEVTKKVDRDEVEGIAEGVLARKSRR